MITLNRAGGIAAVVEALLYVAGFAVLLTLLDPGSTEGWSHAQKLAFVLESKTLFQTWTTCIYVVFGLVLVVLAVALHERLTPAARALMQVATPLGLIWAGLVIASGMVATVGLEAVEKIYSHDAAQAVTVWTTIVVLQDGLGGGVEIVGGLWLLLISAASRRAEVFPKTLAYLGFVVGTAGVVTVVPSLGQFGTVFGLGQILWFAWTGVCMLRRDTNQSVFQ